MNKTQLKTPKELQLSKRRPSIEESPSLERPVYIITKNLNGHHIIKLLEELDRQKIAYQMQQETATLGFKLNQRFFVIVDNKAGQVVLGAEFGSILMTIVGYPRLGRNKKNKYFQRPEEVVAFYRQFKNDNDITAKQRALIQSQYTDVILENAYGQERQRSKIMVRSISKYKNPEKIMYKGQTSTLNMESKFQDKAKLIVVEDRMEDAYSKICDQLFRFEGKGIERAQSMEVVRKKTLFHTNRTKIYYFVNSRQQRQLISSIFIGQAIVFQNKTNQMAIDSIINEPKIYAIICDKNQIFKILYKIGILVGNDQSKMVPSKIHQTRQQATPSTLQQASHNKQQKVQTQIQNIPVFSKMQKVQEISKIQGNQSVISNHHNQSLLDTSGISQASSKSRRIKRIIKKQPNKSQTKPQSQYYPDDKKQNVSPKLQKNESVSRKNNLKIKMQQKSHQAGPKSKKSLKFVDYSQDQPSKLKKIKSLSKCPPQTVVVMGWNHSTMTQNQYFGLNNKQQKTNSSIKNNVIYGLAKQSIKPSTIQQNQRCINALFYREFIPKFNNVIQFIKSKSLCLFCHDQKSTVYQPFFNSKQFDRSARKIKKRLRQNGHTSQQFRFVVFIIKDELAQFLRYCSQKNKTYEQQEYEMDTMFKSSNLSTTINTTISRIHVSLFIQSDAYVPDETVDLGRIKINKHQFPNITQNLKSQKVFEIIRQKLISSKMIESTLSPHS